MTNGVRARTLVMINSDVVMMRIGAQLGSDRWNMLCLENSSLRAKIARSTPLASLITRKKGPTPVLVVNNESDRESITQQHTQQRIRTGLCWFQNRFEQHGTMFVSF